VAGLQGVDSLIDTLDDMTERAESLSREMSEPVHDELLRQMRAASIPSRTGRLANSLRNPGSPDHIYEETEDGVQFGSRDPAARYNPKGVPRVDTDKVTEVVAGVYTDGD